MISSNCNNGSMYKTHTAEGGLGSDRKALALIHIKSQRSEDR